MHKDKGETDREKARFYHAPEMGGLDLLRAQYTHHHFSRHSHEGYTLGVVERGAEGFFYNGANHVAPPGSVIIINPDSVHTGHAATKAGWKYQAIYPLDTQLKALAQTTATPYFSTPIITDPQLTTLLRQSFATLTTSSDRLQRQSILYAALNLLIERYSSASVPGAEPKADNNKLQLVKDYLTDTATQNTSLDTLAHLAGLNPQYLLRQFQRQFGMPPHAYQIQQRLRKAKQAIASGHNLSDVACECGFFDQSHLTRHFKKSFGITPGEYARIRSVSGSRK